MFWTQIDDFSQNGQYGPIFNVSAHLSVALLCEVPDNRACRTLICGTNFPGMDFWIVIVPKYCDFTDYSFLHQSFLCVD